MVFISTLLSSSLGSRFSNTLESHQIDDDYSEQYDFDTVESSSSSSSLPQSQRQVSSTNLSSGLSSYPDRRATTETTAATATINASNFSSPPSHPRQSLASTPTQPSNCVAVADIDTRFPPSSAAINQYDPYEEVPSYEASQRMHNQSANSNSNNHNSSSSNIAHNNNNYITEDVSHIAPTTHIYTPIPSLPIPITSSTTGISYGNSYDALINNNNNNSSTSNSNNDNRNGIASNFTLRGGNIKRSSIKQLGLKFLNARQHFLLASCRDVSLIPPLIGLIRSWRMIYSNDANNYNQALNGDGVTLIRGSEHFLTGLWCIVAGYLSYSILDSLLVRWIMTYSTSAAIVRVLSMSTIIITIELYLINTTSAITDYGLHIWIFISCVLTFTYIVQNFVTSNLELINYYKRTTIHKRARFFDFYNIVVFAVVPVGLASFVTMVGLLRSLLLLRIEIDSNNNGNDMINLDGV
ncbi:N-glycosylation protein eos1 [Candida albicans]